MSATPLSFKAGGILHDGHFYIERPADAQLLKSLLGGGFCHVLAPHQFGKSSLRARVARRLNGQPNVRCATVDLMYLGCATATTQTWYFDLIDELARQLGGKTMRARAADFWRAHKQVPPEQRFACAVREIVLKRTPGLLIVFFDEIDMMRSLPFASDKFFAALRDASDTHAGDAAYERLSICLLGVNLPVGSVPGVALAFGTRIELTGFDRAALDVLAAHLTCTGADPKKLLDAVYTCTRGHPYMTQCLFLALLPEVESPPHIAPGQEATHVAELMDRLFRRRGEGPDECLDGIGPRPSRRGRP